MPNGESTLIEVCKNSYLAMPRGFCVSKKSPQDFRDTVDGRNPKQPPGM